jgi:hypothetical protein
MRLILALLALLPTMTHATELEVAANTPTPVPGTDIILTLTDVTDQRCPSTADCFWEGMIRVEIAVTKGTDAPQTLVLCNRCDDAVRDAVVYDTKVELRRLAPGRDVLDPMGRNPMLSDYTVTVDVTPAS